MSDAFHKLLSTYTNIILMTYIYIYSKDHFLLLHTHKLK